MNKQVIKHAVILAGGKGTRLAEQTKKIPKPLVEVGNTPILVHIINHLAHYGVEHVVVAGGYKVDLIKEYFMSDRYRSQGSVTFNSDGVCNNHEPVLPGNLKKITIADTGLSTGTAQRIKRATEYFEEQDVPFFMTYGDSVSTVDLSEVTERFYSTDSLITLSAVQYQERFGILKVDPNSGNKITKFAEKSMSTDEFINGGFMAMKPEVVEYIHEDDDDFSKSSMPRMQNLGEISAHIHDGFWSAMDTQRDYEDLNKIYDENPELFIRK